MVFDRNDLESKLDDVQNQLRSFGKLQQELAALEGAAEGADGLIEVKVGPTGNLTSLTIRPQAMRIGSERLAEEILKATKQAAADVAHSANELVGKITGGTTSLGDVITGGPLDSDPTKIFNKNAGHVEDPAKEIMAAFEAARRKMYGHH